MYGCESWTTKQAECSEELMFSNCWGFPDGSDDKASACNAGDPGSIPGWEDPLEKEMETHSSTLAWKIPWTSVGICSLVGYSPWGWRSLLKVPWTARRSRKSILNIH